MNMLEWSVMRGTQRVYDPIDPFSYLGMPPCSELYRKLEKRKAATSVLQSCNMCVAEDGELA